MSAVLAGISVACIVAGFAILAIQLRQRPSAPPTPPSAGAGPSNNGSSPPAPVPPGAGASTRRRVFYGLLAAVIASAVAGAVLQERLVWGIHLFVDDVFLGYLAWLVHRAQGRTKAAGGEQRSAALRREPEDSEGRKPKGGGEVQAVEGRVGGVHHLGRARVAARKAGAVGVEASPPGPADGEPDPVVVARDGREVGDAGKGGAADAEP